MSSMNEHYLTVAKLVFHPASISDEIRLTRRGDGRWVKCDCASPSTPLERPVDCATCNGRDLMRDLLLWGEVLLCRRHADLIKPLASEPGGSGS